MENDKTVIVPEKNKKKKRFDFKKKNIQLIIAAVLGLVAIIIYLSTLGTGQKSEVKSDDVTAKQIEEVLSKINGAGKVSVVITYSDGGETIYAKNTVTETETVYDNGKTTETINEKSEIVLVGGKPLVEKQLKAKVLGVVIVSKGANNPSVKLELVRAIETLFGIDGSLIKIFLMT